MKPYRLVTSLIALGLAAWLGLVVGDRSFPTRVERVELKTPVVKRGGELLTERTVYRDHLCHTTIERMMFDSRGVRFDLLDMGLGTITYPNGTGSLGRDTFTGRQVVPEAMEPGPARYEALVCYRCNAIQWLWPLCEPTREQRFTVEP